jgi:hypothetical protein
MEVRRTKIYGDPKVPYHLEEEYYSEFVAKRIYGILNEDGMDTLDSEGRKIALNAEELKRMNKKSTTIEEIYQERQIEKERWIEFKLTGLPPSSNDKDLRYIGYPYTSCMNSMPVQDVDMQPVNLTKMYVKFSDCFKPIVFFDPRKAYQIRDSYHVNGVSSFTYLGGFSTKMQFGILHNSRRLNCWQSGCSDWRTCRICRRLEVGLQAGKFLCIGL